MILSPFCSHFLTYRVLQLGDRGSPVLNVPIQKSEVESVIQSMLDYSSSAEDFCYSLLCDRLGFVKVQVACVTMNLKEKL